MIHDKNINFILMHKILFIIVIVMLALVLPTAFLHEKVSRVIFYNCSYLSIVGLVINYKKIPAILSSIKIALPFLCLGLLFTIWSTVCHYQLQDNENKELLFTPGKRMFLAAIISFYVISAFKSELLSRVIIKKILLASFITAFILASIFGISQGFISSERILLGINRATLTAYAYSALSLGMMAIISRFIENKSMYAYLIATIIISLYVVLLTETRSAIIIHLILSAVLFLNTLWLDKKLKLSYVVIFFGALIAIALVNSKIIETRFNNTTQDIKAYHEGNDQTSLGARFSMWKVGIISFHHYPFGATQSDRNHYIQDYLIKNKQKNSAVFQYLDVHLHNEVIQYSSLFGITGLIILLYFYIGLIFRNGIPGVINNPISMIVVSIFLYGMTDVLLTSIEFIVIISTLITMSYLICYTEQK